MSVVVADYDVAGKTCCFLAASVGTSFVRMFHDDAYRFGSKCFFKSGVSHLTNDVRIIFKSLASASDRAAHQFVGR